MTGSDHEPVVRHKLLYVLKVLQVAVPVRTLDGGFRHPANTFANGRLSPLSYAVRHISCNDELINSRNLGDMQPHSREHLMRINAHREICL